MCDIEPSHHRCLWWFATLFRRESNEHIAYLILHCVCHSLSSHRLVDVLMYCCAYALCRKSGSLTHLFTLRLFINLKTLVPMLMRRNNFSVKMHSQMPKSLLTAVTLQPNAKHHRQRWWCLVNRKLHLKFKWNGFSGIGWPRQKQHISILPKWNGRNEEEEEKEEENENNKHNKENYRVSTLLRIWMMFTTL